MVKDVVEDMVEKSQVSDNNTAEAIRPVQSASAVLTTALESAAVLVQHSTLWLQQQCSGSHQADYDRFWQFSLAMYPNWQQPLLTLQDQYQARVNLLLLLAFVARPLTGATRPDTATQDITNHRSIEPHVPNNAFEKLTAAKLSDYLAMLQSATEPTQQQLLPLRAQRRLLDKAKPEEALLRQQLLALELAIEQQEQQRLIDAWLDVSRLHLADKPELECCDAMPQPPPLALYGRWLLDYYLAQLQLPHRSEIQQLLLG